MRSTDAETGIQRIFDKERVQKEVEAQVAITKAFGQQASKAVGDYAGKKFEELKNTDPEEAAKWAEGGVYRSMAHAVVGGLTGGAGGALGAGAASLSADALNQLTQDMPASSKRAAAIRTAAPASASAWVLKPVSPWSPAPARGTARAQRPRTATPASKPGSRCASTAGVSSNTACARLPGQQGTFTRAVSQQSTCGLWHHCCHHVPCCNAFRVGSMDRQPEITCTQVTNNPQKT